MINFSAKKLTRQLIILPVVLVFFNSCAPVKPAVETNKEVITVNDLSKGQSIFENSCGKCHDLPNPADHSAQDWVGIMNRMAPKAKLTEEQHQLVYDYIVTAKK